MALNFSPDQFNPHFSYNFYKKQIFDESSDHKIDEQSIQSLEQVVNNLLNGDAKFRILCVADGDDLVKSISSLLNDNFRTEYINCTPEAFWEGANNIPDLTSGNEAVAKIKFIKTVDWQNGKLATLSQQEDAIIAYNLSGYFPYEPCPGNADLIIIPFNAAVGMEALGGILLINERSSLIQDVPVDHMNARLVSLSMKMFEDINAQIDMIRRDYLYNHVVLTQAIKEHPDLELVIQDDNDRSKSIVAFKILKGEHDLQKILDDQKIVLGKCATDKSSIFRVANFHSHSKEQIEKLADVLAEIPPV